MQSVVAAPGATPSVKEEEGQDHGNLFHVVLLDDDEHTYDYVVEMLQKLFFFPLETAFQHAVEVDTTGRTVVITCALPEAQFGRDQIQNYGADHRMPKSKGSMSAILVPAGNTTTL
ncbi:MAG: ATP-dependent Clp protease adaptor ClpS [Acidobacteriota bacterium]|nr:ATP-dependent Clp protease adaptor ClpS [Acidobacteriota bacterium]